MTDPGESPRYRIGTVARLTGISTHALRVWERRYGAVEPDRSGSGDRLYTDEHVERLRRIKRLVDGGHSIGQVAGLSEEALRRLIDDQERPLHLPDTAELRRQFLVAIEDLDLVAAEQLLARWAIGVPPDELACNIIAPLLEEVGQRWERGDLRVVQEHAASALLRNVLGTLMRLYTRDGKAPTAVATTPSGELHEFGALLAALLAAANGWRVLYLGPNLPVDEVVAALDQGGAELLLLSLVNPPGKAERQWVQSLMERVPKRVRILAGGRAAAAYGAALDRATRVASLEEARSLLAER